MLRKTGIIFAALLLFTFFLLLIGWWMKTRKIGNYLTSKYQEKFEFRYSFRDYLNNFRSQYLQIHWGDNAWSYPVIANPKNRPELKFTCRLDYTFLYDNYTYKCLGEELKPYVADALPRDSGPYLLDIYIQMCNFIEYLDTKPTFAELKEKQAQDSTYLFSPVTISIVYKCGQPQNIEPLLDRCIGLVQDTTFGPYTELGCFFVSSEEYDELKQKRDRFPEFLYNYFWPAYRKEEFPALYIHSGLSEELFLKRKQNTLQAYQEYLK